CKREGVENRRFLVVRITAAQVRHRALVGQDPRTLVGFPHVSKETRNRLDVRPLTLRLCMTATPLFNCAKPLLELRRRSLPSTERIAPVTQRDSPISDSTGGIACQSFLESLNGVGELKRMHEGHGSIELWLCYAAARGLEIDDSQVLMRRVLRCLRKSLRCQTKQRDKKAEAQFSHVPSCSGTDPDRPHHASRPGAFGAIRIKQILLADG